MSQTDAVHSVEARPGLRPPVHRVERRAIWFWLLRALCLVVPLVAALAVAYVLWDAARPVLGPLLVAVVGLGVLYVAVMPPWRYAVHRWETTDEAVYARSGWYVREWRVAPISRIQTVDTSRGPIEQLLGLATLAVTTASSHGAIDIRGLDEATAAATADRLTTITEQTPGDQT
jgi:uncharacterized protein